MAKRFTDTEKWKKPWFRKLEPKFKIAWEYLCDNCDHAGIWTVDLDLLCFQTGVKLGLPETLDALQDRVLLFDGGEKLWIIPFFEFQYGSSKDSFRAKSSALQVLRKHGLIDEEGIVNKDLSNSHVSVHEDLGKSAGIGIGISKGKGIGKEGGVGETNSFDLDALYRKYPRKEGKASGIKQCEDQIRTQADYDLLSKAIDRYSDHCRKTDQIVKHFSSFIGTKRTGHPWRDWLEPETGEGAIPTGEVHSPKADLSHIFGEEAAS